MEMETGQQKDEEEGETTKEITTKEEKLSRKREKQKGAMSKLN